MRLGSPGTAEVTGWLRRNGLDERLFLLRHLDVRASLSAVANEADASTATRPVAQAVSPDRPTDRSTVKRSDRLTGCAHR